MFVGGAGYVRLVALEKHPGGLDDEEWVAPGLVGDPARGWFIERLAGDQGQLLGIVGSQRVQSQGDRVLDPTAPLGPNVQEFVASRAQDEQWHPMVPPEQFLDQLQQIWLGQLKVLQHKDDRACLRHPLEEHLQSSPDLGAAISMSLPTFGFDVLLESGQVLLPQLGRIAFAHIHSEAEGQAQPSHHPLCVRGRTTPLDDLLETAPQLGGRRVPRRTQLTPDHVGDGSEGHIFLELAGPAGEDLGILGKPGNEFLDQTTLADARLTEDRDQVVSPARISPGAAASCSRAARFTAAPATRNWSPVPDPVATGPELMPTRTRRGTGSARASPRRTVRSRMAKPARTARSASS